MSRRAVLAGGALALTASCSSPAARPSDPDGPLTYWSALRGSDTVVEVWNETHPDEPIVFDAVTSGGAGGNAKLANAARAGNAPDIVSIEDADLPAFAVNGIASDLTDLVSPDLRSAILPQAWAGADLAGRTFGVPLDVGPMLLLYREDVLRAHRVDLPTTWQEFRDAAAQVRSKAGAHLATFHPNAFNTLSGYAMATDARWFAAEHGGGDDAWVIDMTDPSTRRVADFWQDLVDDDLVAVAPGSSQEWLAAMASGATVGHVVGAWGQASVARSVPGGAGLWRVAPLPQWDPADPVIGTDGVSFHIITAASAKKERAMRFLEWVSASTEGIVARMSSGKSSIYPAGIGLAGAAADQFDSSFYGGQDLFSVVGEQAEILRTGWSWGPRTASTATTVHDGLARLQYGTTIVDALSDAEASTVAELESLGLTVRRG